MCAYKVTRVFIVFQICQVFLEVFSGRVVIVEQVATARPT